MKKSTILIALFFLAAEIQAQSYEGYIANTYPIWVDLIIPASDGEVTGAYFYKQYGGSITLFGTKTGNSINLIEKDSKQKVTGIFACTDLGDNIKGIWRKKKGGDSLTVRLYKTDSTYKKFAKIPKADKLILANGSTLDAELKQSIDGSGKKPKMVICFAQKKILSTVFEWWTMGAYPSSGGIYHTFDLTTNKEIFLSKEIDRNKLKNFNSIICAELQRKLTEHRKIASDSEWVKALEPPETEHKPFKEYFTVSDSLCDIAKDNIDIYWLEGNKLNIWAIRSLFGLPHCMQGLDFSCHIEIPFSELNLYLKPTSILRNLAKTP